MVDGQIALARPPAVVAAGERARGEIFEAGELRVEVELRAEGALEAGIHQRRRVAHAGGEVVFDAARHRAAASEIVVGAHAAAGPAGLLVHEVAGAAVHALAEEGAVERGAGGLDAVDHDWIAEIDAIVYVAAVFQKRAEELGEARFDEQALA